MERRPFLKWLLLVSLTLAGTFILFRTGFAMEVWHKDSSYISAITFAFFLVMTGVVGNATWKACSLESQDAVCLDDVKALKVVEEAGWFCSEICLALGMLGTIIGFCMMLAGFESLDLSNATTIQGLLGDLGRSMGTALYTTLVGLTCGSILKAQCFNLGLEIGRHANAE